MSVKAIASARILGKFGVRVQRRGMHWSYITLVFMAGNVEDCPHSISPCKSRLSKSNVMFDSLHILRVFTVATFYGRAM